MKMPSVVAGILAGILNVALLLSAAENVKDAPSHDWPQWRGPNPNGPVPDAGDPPVNINLARQVRFKVDVPAEGQSSPIIWGDRIYLTGEKNRIMAFERASGKLLWNTALDAPAAKEGGDGDEHEDAGGAAPTPVTDGKHICATFGTGIIGCVDRDGKQVWAQRLTPGWPVSQYGLASSPVLYGDTVIQVVDQGKDPEANASFIVALRTADGKQVWKKTRPVTASWSSPLLARLPEGDTLITVSVPLVIAYDPKTGDERWRAEGLPHGDFAASPIFCGGLVVAVPCGGSSPMAIKPGGKGDVSKTHVVEWTGDVSAPAASSPATDGERYFQVSKGVLLAANPANGKELWKLELDGEFWASPVVAAGRIYAIDRTGTLYVASTEGRKLAECDLGEPVNATPAILDGRIYIRAAGKLLCLGRP